MNSNMISYGIPSLSSLCQRDIDCSFKAEEESIYYPQEDSAWMKTEDNLHTSAKGENRNSKQKRYPCGYCDQSFSQISNLKRHEKVHTGERPYTCELCNRGFSTYSNLKQHEQVHQESDNRKRFSCKFCPRSYYYHSSLKKHMKLHQNEKNISTEASDSVDHHEYEPSVRKQVHIPESTETSFDKRSETKIDSPAVALTLSLLSQKLDLLKKLHELKIAQLQKLQSAQANHIVEKSLEKLERQEEEAILVQMLTQVSKNCSLALSQPEITQKRSVNPAKNNNALRLNIVSTEPSQECSTSSKMNNSSGASSPRSVSSAKLNRRDAFPSTLDSHLNNLIPKKADSNISTQSRTNYPSPTDCDGFFADFTQNKSGVSENEMEILSLVNYEAVDREMSEFKNLFELKGTNFHQESYFSLNLTA